MLNIDRKKTEAKWFDLNKDIKLQIRPFPFARMSSTEIMPMMKEQFVYCLVDWEGIKEGKDKFEVNDANKEYLYSYYPAIRDFVIVKSREGLDDLDDLKN